MRILTGIIISNKMQKTVVVEVTRRFPHPFYKKLIKKSNKFKADTGDFKVSLGDKVRIIETSPFSKDKNFKILEIVDIKKSKGEAK